MRILYIDIDTLRADHLGCYGYHRNTTPNIDRLAAEGLRMENCYASDVPCLPSRSALGMGRFGTRTGVVGHGGTAADPRPEGPGRSFSSKLARTTLAERFSRCGHRTASISSFAHRHSALHWLAGFHYLEHPGKRGLEGAEEITPLATHWLDRYGQEEDWFLHVHYWDPHTPYRAPDSMGEPFKNDPLPDWYNEARLKEHWDACGPHSAQEASGFTHEVPSWLQYPRQPTQVDSMGALRRVIDGYDTGILYADQHVGRLLDHLEKLGVLEDTCVVVSSDHGETFGELGIYCDHHTADEHVSRLPMVIRMPGMEAQTGRVDRALHYQFDVAATLLECAGGSVPEEWDAQGFQESFVEGRDEGRDFLVITQGAWTAQRGVRFEDYLFLRTYHCGYHAYPELMLFDLQKDPHETHNLVDEKPEIVAKALDYLVQWLTEVADGGAECADPIWTVLAEGGPYAVRGALPEYLERLRNTGRAHWAETLGRIHPREAGVVRES